MKENISGKIHWFLFIALLVILLLNLLIAMMGDTYAKVFLQFHPSKISLVKPPKYILYTHLHIYGTPGAGRTFCALSGIFFFNQQGRTDTILH